MKYDFAVIGGGIVGASLAAELIPYGNTVLFEAEDVCGYHSTGRSAAFWHETLGGPLVQPLSKASLGLLQDGGFLHPRVSLEVALADQVAQLEAFERSYDGTGALLTRVDAEGIRKRVPRAKAILVAGLVEDNCADIDVAALHQHYLTAFRRGGGVVKTNFRVDSLERVSEGWTIASREHQIKSTTVINASGAWADIVAKLAGAKPLGIQPLRRTIAQCRVNGDDVPADLPLVIDIAETYYFKPEGPNRVWLCPHDETPVDAGDVAPEELDVAIAIDRFETVTDWKVLAVERKWAGLRSFAPDRLPVFGFDRSVPGFFWCVGQGGYGIQTAPAAAKLCAAMVTGTVPDTLVAAIDPTPFSPLRFASGT